MRRIHVLALVAPTALGCATSAPSEPPSVPSELCAKLVDPPAVRYRLSTSLERLRWGPGKILPLDDIRAEVDRGFRSARHVDPAPPRFVFVGWTDSTEVVADGVGLVTLDRRRGPAEGEPRRAATEVRVGSRDDVVTDVDVVLFGSNVPWTVRNAWSNEIPLSYRLAHDVCLALGVDHELLTRSIGGLGGFGCLNDEPEREGEW